MDFKSLASNNNYGYLTVLCPNFIATEELSKISIPSLSASSSLYLSVFNVKDSESFKDELKSETDKACESVLNSYFESLFSVFLDPWVVNSNSNA